MGCVPPPLRQPALRQPGGRPSAQEVWRMWRAVLLHSMLRCRLAGGRAQAAVCRGGGQAAASGCTRHTHCK